MSAAPAVNAGTPVQPRIAPQLASVARAQWPVGRLVAASVLAVVVHGYHLGADDAAIYLPAVKRVADPSLYPFGAEFFLAHARLSLFPNLIGGSARLVHLAPDAAIFAWHLAAIFLLLTAGWQLLRACFTREAARWCGIALLAASFSVPVAGTGLAIMDPYLTARSLSTPASLFAVAAWLSGRWRRAGLCLLATAAMHPQMAVYGAALIGTLSAFRFSARYRLRQPAACLSAVLPFALDFSPVTGAARACLLSRTFLFVSTWAWYEWIGVIAPLLLVAWWAHARPSNTGPAFRDITRALLALGIVSTAAALLLTLSPRFEPYNRLQPMRSFHLIYVVFFALLGGLLGEYALRSRPLRWGLVFLPVIAGMVAVDRSAYPASPHIELPGRPSSDPWLAAFAWVRAHTPKDAVFALDPAYMSASGEDAHGFRAVAERSVLPDALKDSGAVSMFPNLAPEWSREVAATQGLNGFRSADFARLAAQYPVTWTVTTHAPAGMLCPFRKDGIAVCRL
jgi:hypothetical protein